MKTTSRIIFFLLFCFCFTELLFGQTTAIQPQNKGVAKFAGVIKQASNTSSGLLVIYKQDDRYYAEIPDSLLGRYFMIVSKIASTPAVLFNQGSGGVYGGDPISSAVVAFEKSGAGKLLLKQFLFEQAAADSSTNGMYHSLQNSNTPSIVAGFDIKALSKNEDGCLIDLTDYLNTDNPLFFLSQAKKEGLKLGAYQADKSAINFVQASPTGIQFNVTKTYSYKTSGFASLRLHSTLLLLPHIPLKRRYADPRVGYTTRELVDFDKNPAGYRKLSLANRWRLEPKPGDMARFGRGELVEPLQPIVYYIDPATPAKWIPYIIKGVNDWLPVFERIGFKNAIIVKLPPAKTEDSTWSLLDASHSAILWQASMEENSLFGLVTDPRSGEIISSSIRLLQGILQFYHDNYIIQTSPAHPEARKLQIEDAVIGRFITKIVSHETGHNLGLKHNFIASHATPVEKLRDKKWVEANGLAGSIMDYVRFNYVAQPGDNMGTDVQLLRIGVYDQWAIEWGYKIIRDNKTAEEEQAILNKITTQKMTDRKFWFVGDVKEIPETDPRSMAAIIGDNAIISSTYAIKNLQYVIRNLPGWAKGGENDKEDLKRLYGRINTLLSDYTAHVSRYIGGKYDDYPETGANGQQINYVPKQLQQQALQWLSKEIFETPRWLLNDTLLSITGGNKLELIKTLHGFALLQPLRSEALANLLAAKESGEPDTYELADYFSDLQKAIWPQLYNHQPIDMYRRNLQLSYISKMVSLANLYAKPGKVDAGMRQIPVYALSALENLQKDIIRVIPVTTDAGTKAFLKYCLKKINETTKESESEATE